MRIMEVTANRADRRSRQAMVSGMTRGIAGFASVPGAVQGRKDVFLFSAGFENSLVFASEDAGRISEMNRSRESGQIWDVDSSERFGDLSQQAGLDKMLQALRQAGCVVHTIDLASLAAGGAEEAGASRAKVGGNQGLSMIASETGGRYSRNSNDFDEAIRGVLETTSVTYVLSFQPSVKADGKFRRVKVRLKDAARGTRVEHRPGYYAPLPFGQRSSGQRLMISAEQLMAEREGGAIPTQVLAVPLRNPTDPQRRFVPLLIEMDGPSLLDQAIGDRISLQLFAYVFDGDGRIHGMFTQTVQAAVEAARATLEQTGVKFYGALSLPPGDYELRILVTGVDTGLTNLRIVPLSVGDASGPELLVPMFPDPLGKWLLARRHASSEDALGFPFLADGTPFLPAAAPAVAREGEGQRLYLLGAELGDVSGLQGRLLAADGSASALRRRRLRDPDRAARHERRRAGKLHPADRG
jgi:hypothetical protein